MAEIGCLPGGIRQPALVEDLEKEIPDLRVRLLELVEQNDRERLLPDPRDQGLGIGGGVAAA